MRITNPLHFTEQHRFSVYRDFSLSPLDYKMLVSVYQPIVGALAIGLYTQLFQQLPAEQTGYSELDLQRSLFLAIDVKPGEQGRRLLAEQASRLEAVSLLESNRCYFPSDEYVYLYRLQRPLEPDEFFHTPHLALLLRDKLGEAPFRALQSSFQTHTDAEQQFNDQAMFVEDVTVPFYEWFRLDPQEAVAYQVEAEEADSFASGMLPNVRNRTGAAHDDVRFEYADIIVRFPRDSGNRGYIENLKYEPDSMQAINYVALKYDLTLPELCRLLDEDDIFDRAGELRLEVLQQKANLTFRQGMKRDGDRQRYLNRAKEMAAASTEQQNEQAGEKTALVGEQFYLEVPELLQTRFSAKEYNEFLRNQPYTRVLRLFFPGMVPSHVLNIFENIDLNYKLNEEVVNVLIHYLKAFGLSWNKRYVDSIAADLLGKQIDSYEKAVQYTREQTSSAQRSPTTKGKTTTMRQNRKKPQIPIITAVPEDDTPLTEQELLEIQKMVKELDGS